MEARSYQEFYSRPVNDPFGGDYSTLFTSFMPPGPPTAGELRESFGLPGDCSVFAFLNLDGRVNLAHRMAHFRTPLGLPTSANNNKYVALRGEITGGGGNYVSIAKSFFAEVLVPNVRSTTDISTAFASAAATQLDSSMIGDPGVTDVATRWAMWVPPAYIPQLFALLASGPITPRLLWTLAETVLADPLQAVSCLPFVDWCRAVAAGGLNRANPLQMTNGANAMAPVGLWLDLALGNCRGTMLASDFPTLALPAQAAQPFVNAIGDWRAELAEREDRRVAQRELELVQKRLPSRNGPTPSVAYSTYAYWMTKPSYPQFGLLSAVRE
jgi:hypothetical protein